MRLSEFIHAQMPSIINEWINFAESLTPAANSMSRLQLKDHIEQILQFIATDIESAQSPREQVYKSHGKSDQDVTQKDSASEIHGSIRHADGFDIVQMVSEYRALRASIIKLWTHENTRLSDRDMADLIRFNESIDQSLAESVARFMQKVEHSKDLLLGILGHDMRSPLGAITMSSRLLTRVGELNEKQTAFNDQIQDSAIRVTKIVTDLLDLTRARLGSGLPIKRHTMDLGELAEHIVQETRVQNPHLTIILNSTGNNHGDWDRSRLGQVFSNLITNAVQYGSKDFPITVTVTGTEKVIRIIVHNRGPVISSSQLAILFNSFTRGANGDVDANNPTANLGLGLFITKEIITAHGGSIHVDSTQAEGTAFKIDLPREAPADEST